MTRARWRPLVAGLGLAGVALAAIGVLRAQEPPPVPLTVAVFDEVWQTVHDNYFDPSFDGVDWNAVRDELRPKAAAAASMDDARAVIATMLARMKKSHFALLPASTSAAADKDDQALGGEAVVDIDVRVFNDALVVTRVGAGVTDRLVMGDRIVAIDGTPMTRAPGMSDLTMWRRANAALHGAPGSTAGVTIETAGRRAVIPAARRTPIGERVQFSNLPPLRVRVEEKAAQTPAHRLVGVIGFNIWMAQVNAPFEAAVDRFRAAAGIVIDLRGNPGGLAAMIMGIAGHFIDRPDVLGTMRTRQVPRLQFVVNPRRSTLDGRTVAPYAGPVAVIVDELTASASECFTGALQDLGRVRVFGRRSMGQALPAQTKRLVNGDVLEYVVGDFVTSRGRSLEGHGVMPDEVQPLDPAVLQAGVDAPLRAALAWVDRQAKPTVHSSHLRPGHDAQHAHHGRTPIG